MGDITMTDLAWLGLLLSLWLNIQQHLHNRSLTGLIEAYRDNELRQTIRNLGHTPLEVPHDR